MPCFQLQQRVVKYEFHYTNQLDLYRTEFNFAISFILWKFSIAHEKVNLSLLHAVEAWDVEGPTFCLDSRFTDGGEIANLTLQPPFTPRKIPGTHFY
jgi:hypothetical protein